MVTNLKLVTRVTQECCGICDYEPTEDGLEVRYVDEFGEYLCEECSVDMFRRWDRMEDAMKGDDQ